MHFFNMNIETYDCIIEVLANENLQRNTIRAPREIIEHQFFSLVNQAAKSPTPVRVGLYRTERIFSEFEDNKHVERLLSIIFANNLWVSSHEEYFN